MPEIEIHFFEVLTNHTKGDAFIFSYNNQRVMIRTKLRLYIERQNNRWNFYQCLFSFDSWLWQTCVQKKAHSHRQSFLLSDQFPSMLNRWRTKITSISTRRTYQSINVPVTSFLAKSQPVSKLEKNCRKRGNDTPPIRKTAIPAKMRSSCQNRDRWLETTLKNTHF